MPIPSKPLTALAASRALPGPKPYKLSDGLGLYLLIQPTGGRFWRMNYRFDGKQKTLSLGPYPETSLALARSRRDDARRLLTGGEDPSAVKRREQDARKVAAENSFEVVSAAYRVKRSVEGIGPAALSRDKELLAIACAAFGRRPVSEIRPAEILEAARRIEAREKSALRFRSTVSRVFRYAVAQGLCEMDPAAVLVDALIRRPVVHHASPKTSREIGALLRAVRSYEGSVQTRIAMSLGILVFVRPGELRTAEWSEMDTSVAIWRIPAAKMKMRRDHLVPLSRQALALIDRLRSINGGGRYLFPSIGSPNRCMSDFTLNAALRRLGYTADQVVGHGFRSMASTVLHENGEFPSDWIERQLAHLDKNTIRSIYNAAEYLDGRRRMMQWYADWLDEREKRIE